MQSPRNSEAECFRGGAHAYVATFYSLATCEAIKSFQIQSTDDSTQQRFAPTGQAKDANIISSRPEDWAKPQESSRRGGRLFR